MRIALCGTSPYSVRQIPFGDKSWAIWGCAPGLYPIAGRLDAWFEIHRWEPPTLGVASMQVPWFTPEYCGWMAQRQHVVWMAEKLAAIPNSQALPVAHLVKKYGHYFFTSSLAWMAAMAIEAILLNRELLATGDDHAIKDIDGEPDAIGFWGVDMSTEEEYVQQRSGCQFFATLAASMNIKVIVPPESDLLIPPALYGIAESSPRAIRYRARMDMMRQRKAEADAKFIQANRDVAFMDGQIEAEQYHIRTWTHEGECRGALFEEIFAKPILPADKIVPLTPKEIADQAVPVDDPVPLDVATVDEAPRPAESPFPSTMPLQGGLAEAKLAGDNPHDPVKAQVLVAHGLERLCGPEWCRVKPEETCDCIAPIEAPST